MTSGSAACCAHVENDNKKKKKEKKINTLLSTAADKLHLLLISVVLKSNCLTYARIEFNLRNLKCLEFLDHPRPNQKFALR